jgi:uncharacterized protein
VTVVSDSSPLITLARARQLDLLREFYGQVAIPREVYQEVTVAGAGLPGAEEVRTAPWIRVKSDPSAASATLQAACFGLGAGERSAIYLAIALSAEVVLIDEEKARRAAKGAGLAVVGSIAVLERGARLKKVPDLRSVYLSLLEQGIRFDHKILEQRLDRLGLGKLKVVIRLRLLRPSGDVLEAADIRLDLAPKSRLGSADGFLPDGMTLDGYEQSIIREALNRASGNKSQAARLLGLTRNALRYRLSQMGIES